ncbi:hypothetical protein ID866_1875 [Astraeus odoratus]|nr:hypothetical protein ID866_1875 [Astraeus odoratus]
MDAPTTINCTECALKLSELSVQLSKNDHSDGWHELEVFARELANLLRTRHGPGLARGLSHTTGSYDSTTGPYLTFGNCIEWRAHT